MSHDPNGRIDRDLAERLLRGDPVGPDGLADLLAAAGAPVSTGPLPGEEQALAAFQRGGATPASRPRRRIMIKLALAQLIATKAFAATAAAAAVGGVAVAAATGTLPLPGHHDGTMQSGPVAGGETSHSEQPSGDGHKSESPSARPSEPGHTTPSANPSEHPSEHPTTTPSETHAPAPVSYGDLCRGLLSGQGGEVSVKLTWPQYAPLLAKGGGTKSGAVEYCVKLLGLSPTPSEHPSPTSSETHSPTPTPNPSETHSPTPTPNPSETHTPTASPTSSQL